MLMLLALQCLMGVKLCSLSTACWMAVLVHVFHHDSNCRRMKAAFAAYKERQLPLMKEEKPGLKQSQYQDMIFKAWQKSPENPLIRAQLAGKR